MDDDLVVRLRTEIAKRNLERVSHLAQSLKEYEGGLAEFLELPGRLGEETQQVWNTVHRMRGSQDELMGNRDRLEEGLRELDSGLSQLRSTLRHSSERANQLRDDMGTLTTKQDITTLLTKKAEQTQRALTVAKYWKQQQHCDEIFSEYVDLLGGIALRTGRLKVADGDVPMSDLFLIADHLPETWPSIEFSWQSLTVPARIERNSSTIALVLRIGFPEWTIWALPLLQHEFGHVFARWKRMLGSPPPASCSDGVVAEALATLVSGPAYACASLLLRQDPTAVVDAADEPALRCATVLATLEHVAREVGDAELRTLAERLTGSWRIAVEEAGGDASALDAALVSPVCDEAREHASSILTEEGANAEAPVWATKWATIGTWAKKLATGAGGTIDGAAALGQDVATGPMIALLLNATWLARVGSKPEQDARPDQVVEIAEAAVARMLELVSGSGRASIGPTNV